MMKASSAHIKHHYRQIGRRKAMEKGRIGNENHITIRPAILFKLKMNKKEFSAYHVTFFVYVCGGKQFVVNKIIFIGISS